MTAADLIGGGLVLAGSVLVAIAGVGQVRFRDLFTRMHVATKPSTLGLLLVAVGAMVLIPGWAANSLLFLVIVLQFATAPVSAHLVGRAAHRRRQWDRTAAVRDDLSDADEL